MNSALFGAVLAGETSEAERTRYKTGSGSFQIRFREWWAACMALKSSQ
jgi:hypothetical protein